MVLMDQFFSSSYICSFSKCLLKIYYIWESGDPQWSFDSFTETLKKCGTLDLPTHTEVRATKKQTGIAD